MDMNESTLSDSKIEAWISQFEETKHSILEIGPFRKGTILKLFNLRIPRRLASG